MSRHHNWFSRQRHLRKKPRNSTLVTCHYPDLCSASDWLKQSQALSRSAGSNSSWVWNFCPRRHFAENQWWRYKTSAVFSRYIVFHLDQTVVFSSRTVSKEFCASWESSSSTSSSHLQVARVKTEPDELLPLEFDRWRAPGASSVKEKPRGPYAELSVGSNSSPVCSTVDSWGI